MRGMYIVLAAAMLFMFIFIADHDELGTSRTLLSAGFIGAFFLSLAMFVLDGIGQKEPKPPRESEEDKYLREQREYSKKVRSMRRR